VQARFSGSVATCADGDTQIPVMVRGSEVERKHPKTLPVRWSSRSGASPVVLAAIAKVEVASEPSVILRRDLVRT